MMGKIAVTLAAFATLVFSTPSLAESICGERSRFIGQLSERYGEQTAAVGLAAGGSVVEVLTSKVGSWTIIVTHPSGTTCVIASGQAWQAVPKLALGPAA